MFYLITSYHLAHLSNLSRNPILHLASPSSICLSFYPLQFLFIPYPLCSRIITSTHRLCITFSFLHIFAPNLFIACFQLVHSCSLTCSHLVPCFVQSFYLTCSQLVINLFLIFIHSLFLLVHSLFLLFLILYLVCSYLAPCFVLSLYLTCSYLVLNLFLVCSWFRVCAQ